MPDDLRRAEADHADMRILKAANSQLRRHHRRVRDAANAVIADLAGPVGRMLNADEQEHLRALKAALRETP